MRILYTLLIISSFSLLSMAQTGMVIGITGQHLVQVNLETGALSPLQEIQQLPAGVELRNLVYVAADKAFYTTMYTKTNPTLVRLRLDGSWEKVDVFRYDEGAVPYFCEGLAYDTKSDRMLLAASLDGSIPEDKKSESLLEVDRSTAECRVVARLRQNVPPDDFDEIAFFGNQLFCLDGTPGINNTYVFPFASRALQGELFAGTKQNIPYFTMDDVLTMEQLLYFPNNRDQHLYYYDLMARKWSQVAPLSGPAILGRIKLTGLAYVPLEQA